ncbi:MAG: hypothetical protein HY097_04800 [Nitrospinae bacterium]|nr:hypothetical protein [Nitrospinota bacterium]MBI3813449.1 hypothetical protein [Nitrospinota bacterium]
MKKTVIIFTGIFLMLILGVTLVIAVPNSLSRKISDGIKARGYMEYSPDDAKRLAMQICTQCHDTERIAKYCHRCGPPFIAVIPHMKKFIADYKMKDSYKELSDVTDYQAAAIIQTWNALVGNWEADFRKQDLVKLIGDNKSLLELLNTPIEKRKIEYALRTRGDKVTGAYQAGHLGEQSGHSTH